jgi:RecB family exonuclease
VITPRRTRLIRVPHLRALHAAIADLACRGDVPRVRATAVIVSSSAAAATLRNTLERRLLDEAGLEAVVWPSIVNRDQWYALLRDRLPQPPPLLTAMDRQVVMAAASRDAASQGHEPPFTARPGLVAAMLDLYDELRRQPQILDRFEDLLVSELESAVGIDRGADRLLRQTRFLVASFRAYEDRTREAGRVDEHQLRARLAETEPADPLRHAVVTVGDRAAGADGLWPADFDLLTRLPLLDAVDIVATEAELGAGLGARLHDLLPGIEEAGEARVAGGASGARADGRPSVLVAPPGDESVPRYFTVRDREEELAQIARRIKLASRGGVDGLPSVPLDRSAVVFARPLPYLYLARSVFESAGVPFQASDALPLAAEPFAATLDLVLSAVTSTFGRGPLVALLGSPHLRIEAAGEPIGAADVAALEEALAEQGYFSGLAGLASGAGGSERAAQVLSAAADVARTLAPLSTAAPASAHLSLLLAFLHAHDRPPALDDPLRERHLRARTAIVSGINMLLDAHRALADPVITIDDIAATLRRWIEQQTFSPRIGDEGLHLVDAQAARYGDFEAVHVVGLIDGEWPSPSGGNVFYSSGLLRKLGWPPDRDRQAAARARFDDLIRLPARALSASTFSLEQDSIVEPSPLLEALDVLDAPVVRVPASRVRIFRHEALAEAPMEPGALDPTVSAWARLRASRTPPDDRRYRGFTGAVPARRYSVGGLERHLECPFKYFADRVLALEPEKDDEAVMTPLERGRFVHQVFSQFFEAWQRRGGATITPDRIDDALELFADVLEPLVRALPRSEALVERTRLMGSPVQPGMAETVFRVEAERGSRVVERLLEYELKGEFAFTAGGETRTVALTGVADRIDLVDDGTLRVIDYKTGTPPKAARALQLPIYSLCAERALDGRSGRRWSVRDALYISFKGRPVVPLFARGMDRDKVLDAATGRLLKVVGAIERGEFPVQPDQPFLCTYCAFSSVCRKDYVDP